MYTTVSMEMWWSWQIRKCTWT